VGSSPIASTKIPDESVRFPPEIPEDDSPREIPARYPAGWPCRCTRSSRLTSDATQIAGVQVGVDPRDDQTGSP
jgi:hypothetical protein